MDVYLTAETAPVSYNGEDRPAPRIVHGAQYLLFKTGPVDRLRRRGRRLPAQQRRRPLARHPDPLPAGLRRRPRPPALRRPRRHDQHLQPAPEEHRLGHAAHPPTRSTRPPSTRTSSATRTTGSSRSRASSAAARSSTRQLQAADQARVHARRRRHAPTPAFATTSAGGRRPTTTRPARCKMGTDDMAVVDTAAARARPRRAARHRRLDHADADQRQHPGAVDHDRREGRRHGARGAIRLGDWQLVVEPHERDEPSHRGRAARDRAFHRRVRPPSARRTSRASLQPRYLCEALRKRNISVRLGERHGGAGRDSERRQRLGPGTVSIRVLPLRTKPSEV